MRSAYRGHFFEKSKNLFTALLLLMAIFSSITPAYADTLTPVHGDCSVLYGAKNSFGLVSDTQISGIFLDNNSCMPITLAVTGMTLSPNKITLAGKPQLIKIHLNFQANSPLITAGLLAAYLHDDITPLQQSNVGGDLCDISLASANNSLLALSSTGKGAWDFGINLPATCPSGSFHFMIDVQVSYPLAAGTESWFELKTIPANKINILNSNPPPVLGSTCKNLSQVVLSSSGDQVICAKINGKLIWSNIPGGKLTGTSTAPSSKPVATISAGQACSTAGKIQSSNGKTFICGVSGKTKKWVLTGSSGSSAPPTSSAQASNTKQPSAADIAMLNGCSSFPNAMTNLYKHQAFGDPFRPSASIALQTASGYFLDAKLGDPGKYALLQNAVFLIYQDVQESIFGGSGYIQASQFDLQNALATFNTACHTSLYIP